VILAPEKLDARSTHPDAFAAWRANELAGEVLLGDNVDGSVCRRRPTARSCATGASQVAAGTEIVLAHEQASAAASLRRVA
jgi:hypothetical protein